MDPLYSKYVEGIINQIWIYHFYKRWRQFNFLLYASAIMSTQVKYEINHTSLLLDSTISSALNFCFYVFYCYLKEKDYVKRNIDSKKRNVYIGNQYSCYSGLPKIRVGRALKAKN